MRSFFCVKVLTKGFRQRIMHFRKAVSQRNCVICISVSTLSHRSPYQKSIRHSIHRFRIDHIKFVNPTKSRWFWSIQKDRYDSNKITSNRSALWASLVQFWSWRQRLYKTKRNLSTRSLCCSVALNRIAVYHFRQLSRILEKYREISHAL